jgi:hypothetical protein
LVIFSQQFGQDLANFADFRDKIEKAVQMVENLLFFFKCSGKCATSGDFFHFCGVISKNLDPLPLEISYPLPI